MKLGRIGAQPSARPLIGFGGIPGAFPRTLGHEPVGEIVAIGAGVTTRKMPDPYSAFSWRAIWDATHLRNVLNSMSIVATVGR